MTFVEAKLFSKLAKQSRNRCALKPRGLFKNNSREGSAMNTFGKRVAVIGAGPSGLAAARYLKAHGFVPVVYDRGERLGGQWSAVAAGETAMRANTKIG